MTFARETTLAWDCLAIAVVLSTGGLHKPTLIV